MRKGSLISCAISNGALSFSVVGVDAPIVVDTKNLSADIVETAMLHGLKQKISDAAALEKGATAEEKHAEMLAVANRLMDGEWSKRSGDGSGPVAGVIYLAFARWIAETAIERKKTAPSQEAIRAKYDSYDRSEQLALRSIPRVATIIEEIKLSRGSAASSVDADALLGDLGI